MADPVEAGGKHPFEYQKPTADQAARIQGVRTVLHDAYAVIMNLVPSSRERSLAITKLEEASMWANKAIVFEEQP